MRGTYLAKAARAIAPIRAASSAVALRISGVLLSVVICIAQRHSLGPASAGAVEAMAKALAAIAAEVTT
jgi:hypothetical protein